VSTKFREAVSVAGSWRPGVSPNTSRQSRFRLHQKGVIPIDYTASRNLVAIVGAHRQGTAPEVCQPKSAKLISAGIACIILLPQQ
jgi:hypothetical protein